MNSGIIWKSSGLILPSYSTMIRSLLKDHSKFESLTTVLLNITYKNTLLEWGWFCMGKNEEKRVSLCKKSSGSTGGSNGQKNTSLRSNQGDLGWALENFLRLLRHRLPEKIPHLYKIQEGYVLSANNGKGRAHLAQERDYVIS